MAIADKIKALEGRVTECEDEIKFLRNTLLQPINTLMGVFKEKGLITPGEIEDYARRQIEAIRKEIATQGK